MIASLIPDAFRTAPQWVGFKLQDGKKVPCVADQPKRKASCTNEKTWRSYAITMRGMDQGLFDAVGFALTGNYTAIDLDDCVTDGKTSLQAQDIVIRCSSYTERSVSKSGVHILLKNTLPGKGFNRNGIEMYSRSRFIILTGDRLSGTPSAIMANQGALDHLMQLVSADVTEQSEHTEQSENAEHTEQSKAILSARSFPLVLIPKASGQRNRCIFQLARFLKHDAGYRDASPKSLRSIVRQWFDLALPNIGTKDFDETWADFVTAWPKASLSLAHGIDEAWERAKAGPVPVEAEQYDTPAVKQLVALCRELSGDDGRFYLSSRTASRLIGASAMQCNRYLRMLCVDEVLREVTKGSQLHRRASRFQWLGQPKRAVTTPI